MSGERPISSRAVRLGVLALCEFAMLLRAPGLVRAPRFYAEEGHFHFAFAFDHGFWETLAYVHTGAGYTNWIANLATACASCVPLELAPAVTTGFALVVQTLPLVIILWGRSLLFRDLPRQLAGCGVVVFAPSVDGEVWLTTLSSQVFFGLIALVILLEDFEAMGPIRRLAYPALLLLGGLSGPYALFLLPVFLLRLIVTRQRALIPACGALVLALAVQQGVVLSLNSVVDPRRFAAPSLQLAATISVHHIGIPLFGEDLTRKLAAGLGEQVFGVAFLVLAPFAFFDFHTRRLRLASPCALLVLAFGIVAAAVSQLALMGAFVGRYAVVPGYALLFCLIDRAALPKRSWSGTVALGLLVVSLAAGVLGYREHPAFACDGAHPSSWSEEVERWRKDPLAARFWKRPVSDSIRICPVGWTMELHRAGPGGQTPSSP